MITSWCLNQPMWKIWSSNWIMKPQMGMNIKKNIFKTITLITCTYQIQEWYRNNICLNALGMIWHPKITSSDSPSPSSKKHLRTIQNQQEHVSTHVITSKLKVWWWTFQERNGKHPKHIIFSQVCWRSNSSLKFWLLDSTIFMFFLNLLLRCWSIRPTSKPPRCSCDVFFFIRCYSSWWFQPIWKILVKLDYFP